MSVVITRREEDRMRMLSEKQPPINGWLAAGIILLSLSLLALSTQPLWAQAGLQGQWTTLSYLMPINPIHLALLNNGKVLVVSGSGNLPTQTTFNAAVLDPQAGTIVTQAVAWDMFCNGMVVLPDGRAFINGGTLQYDPFHGQPRSSVYDLTTGSFTDVQNMAHGRWYPTVTTLGDGRVMTFSGLTETGGTNTAVEIYTVGSGWSQEYAAGWTPPLYPRMHLVTDGNVFYSGSGTGSRIFNTTTRTWSGVVATTNSSVTRTYGTSVMLPLTPANGYRPRVMILGGGNPATATTEIIDLAASPLQWQYGPSMSQPRIEMNATILPNGKVLAVGGSTNDEDTATASKNADLYDPNTNSFSSAGANAYPRLYHSGSLLLPDGTVMLVGGNPSRGSYEAHIEIYSPSYLFNGDGSAATRPTISSVSSTALSYGAAFQVQTPDAANITSAVLVRPGAPTHAFDMDQRLVGLSYTSGAGVLDVTPPPNGAIAPPGYFNLVLLNSPGVPSVAEILPLSTPGPNQPPTVAAPASATPNPVTATTTNLSVLGADNGGEANLVYTWATTGTPPAPVTFSANGTNAARNAIATFTKAGSYSFQVTIRDQGNLTVTSSVNVTVNQTLIGINVVPPSASVVTGTTQSFNATALDQFGAGLAAQPTFAWSVSGGGTSSRLGLFTAGSPAGGPF